MDHHHTLSAGKHKSHWLLGLALSVKGSKVKHKLKVLHRMLYVEAGMVNSDKKPDVVHVRQCVNIMWRKRKQALVVGV